MKVGLDNSSKMLTISLREEEAEGFLEVDIPKRFMEGNFTVLLNNILIQPSLRHSQQNQTILGISYSNGLHLLSITASRLPQLGIAPVVAISLSAEKFLVGDVITASGRIDPPPRNARVTLIYTSPRGDLHTKVLSAAEDGSFKDIFLPTQSGSWRVSATWDGDMDYAGAKSMEHAFEVNERLPTLTRTAPFDILDPTIIATIALIGIVATVVLIRRRRKVAPLIGSAA